MQKKRRFQLDEKRNVKGYAEKYVNSWRHLRNYKCPILSFMEKKKRRFELTLGFFSCKATQHELPRTKQLFNEIANLFSLL